MFYSPLSLSYWLAAFRSFTAGDVSRDGSGFGKDVGILINRRNGFLFLRYSNSELVSSIAFPLTLQLLLEVAQNLALLATPETNSNSNHLDLVATWQVCLFRIDVHGIVVGTGAYTVCVFWMPLILWSKYMTKFTWSVISMGNLIYPD